jgi:hypothetical protein
MTLGRTSLSYGFLSGNMAFGPEDGTAEWVKNMLEFAEDNFNDAGIEGRKTCC